jgi:hypothetical protein
MSAYDLKRTLIGVRPPNCRRNKFANAENTHCAPMAPLLEPKLANSLVTNASYLSLGSANFFNTLAQPALCENYFAFKERSAKSCRMLHAKTPS